MSETNKNIPVEYQGKSERIRLTRRGKAAGFMVAAGLSTAAALGTIHAMEGSDQPVKSDEAVSYVASEETVEVKVRQGEGIDDIVQRVYGIDAPEGTNQVVQNNPEYDAEVAAVKDQMNGVELLHPGDILELPVDFYTQAEFDQMNQDQ